MSTANDTSGLLIYITHFVNPHNFFFKFKNNFFNTKLIELEKDIETFALKWKENNRQYVPNVGDIVAAYSIIWNKWVRAQVKSSPCSSDSAENAINCYNLWAIDHGRPMSLIGTWLVPLPFRLAQLKVDSVSQGGIGNFVPAQSDYKMDKLKVEMDECEQWSQKAIKACKNLITMHAANVFFEINGTDLQQDYYFGALKVQKYDARMIKISDMLEQIHETIYKDDFCKDICKIKLKYMQKHHTIDDSMSVTSSASSGHSSASQLTMKPQNGIESNAKINHVTVARNSEHNSFSSLSQPISRFSPNFANNTSCEKSAAAQSTSLQNNSPEKFSEWNHQYKQQKQASSLNAWLNIVPSEIDGGVTKINLAALAQSKLDINATGALRRPQRSRLAIRKSLNANYKRNDNIDIL